MTYTNTDIPKTHPANNGAVEVPCIELSGVNLTVGRAPADPSVNAFFIGPVFLQVSFDEDAKRAIISALTGVELPPGVKRA